MSHRHPVNAEIVVIGTEIVLGEITDTNSSYIARSLRDIGVNLFYITAVGDNEARIADVIRHGLGRSDLIITSGGLGPTVDDMTRQAIAAATDRGLTFHQYLLDQIAARFASFRATMTENNRRQAYLPDDAQVIENPVGTAPSFIVEHQGRVVIALPGVPRELKFLLHERVIPFLRTRFELGTEIIKARVLKTAGIGESMLDSLIGDELLQQSNPTVGLAAHTGQVDVRITAKAEDEAAADAMIAQVEVALRARMGSHVFGIDGDRIESVLAGLLREAGFTIAVVEAGLPGVIGQGLTAAAGDSIMARALTYDHPSALYQALNLSPETPLRECAERAVEWLEGESSADAVVAAVSQPEITGDRSDQEPGTAIAVRVRGKTVSRSYGFGGGHDVAAAWVSSWGLAMAWRALRDHQATGQ